MALSGDVMAARCIDFEQHERIYTEAKGWLLL
jgi:hypothetical protein